MNNPDAGPTLLPIPENSSCSVTLEGRSLVLVNRRGELFLYENNCPHASESLDPLGGSLSNESGDLIRCQRHGAEFLADSGECVAGPCIGERLQPVAFTAAGEHIYLD
jgi:nitrite reductase/ring-hydroxylating ferredoxin subunit